MTEPSEEPQITFNVKSSGGADSKWTLTLPAATPISEVKSKLSAEEFSGLPADRQRLIFSGRILKDHDTLTSAKVKDGHTIHFIKIADSNARQNPAGSSSTSTGASNATPAVPQMAAGTGNNPLAGLTGARYAGFHGLPGMDTFGPDGGASTYELSGNGGG